MRKLIVSSWITLDGIFDAGTMNQWYTPYDSVERQNYIRDGILNAGAILFGRITFEMLAPYWSSLKNNEMGVAAKLNSVPKYVVSKHLKNDDPVVTIWGNSTVISGDVTGRIARLKQEEGDEIQIEGSANLVQSLMSTNLVDEYRFLVHPVIMGSGKRFFKDGISTSLKLVKNTSFESGVVLLCYEPSK